MTSYRRLAAAALALASLTSLAACGGDDADSGSDAAPTASTPAEKSLAIDGVVEILATAQLKFVPAELSATVGQLFKGRLVQRGEIPHNIEIKDFGVRPGDTLTTKGGDTKEFSFTPSKAGKFTFVCTVHPNEMKGTLTVT